MTAAIAWTRMPTFNHVAMSVPAELLGAEGRRDLLRFYGEVFGWSEMPTMTTDGEQLVLRVYNNEQFVYLHSSAEPMRCPATDHFGMSVGTPRDLDDIFERARRFQGHDPRVEILDKEVQDFKVVKLHSFYLRYLLPLMVEIQCFEWAEGVDASSLGGG